MDEPAPDPRKRHATAVAIGLAVVVAVGLGAWLTLARGSGSPPTGRGYLGVRVVNAQRALSPGAVVVSVVPHTPAAGAGLEPATRFNTVAGSRYPTNGDVIRSVDATDITTAADVANAIRQHHPGDTVLLTLARGRLITWARVKLVRRPANPH